jgi:hypothetical protein
MAKRKKTAKAKGIERKTARKVGITKGPLKFGEAFKYPFNRAAGMLNILWILLPIIGWLALIGYVIRIVKGFVKGNFQKLPLFDFGANLKLGFFMLLKFIPFIFALMVVNGVISMVPVIGFLGVLFVDMFIVPILVINFFNRETISSSFDFSKIHFVFDNFGDYVLAILKSIGLSLVFLLLFIILVGIPGQIFTKNIFLADFYRRCVK